MSDVKWDGEGLPPIDTICMIGDDDVRIIAHTKVAGRSAAVWQFYDEFGYGFEGDFKVMEEE